MSASKPALSGTPYTVPPEPKRLPAILLAIMVHALLLAFLWIGISWQNDTPVEVEAEVWDMKVESAAAPALPPPPAPPELAEPEPAPEPTPAPTPPPAPAVAVEPEPVKPSLADIKLEREKRKLEQLKQERAQREKKEYERAQRELAERKEREEQQAKLLAEQKEADKKAAEKKTLADKKAAEKKELDKKAETEKKLAAEQREADKKKLAQEKAAQAKAAATDKAKVDKQRDEELKRIMGAAGSAGNAQQSSAPKIDAGYVGKLTALIKSNTTFAGSTDMPGNPKVSFRVELLPTGEILSLRLVKSSGVPQFDDAVERGINKSSPLPKKKDGTVERTLVVNFSMKDLN